MGQRSKQTPPEEVFRWRSAHEKVLGTVTAAAVTASAAENLGTRAVLCCWWGRRMSPRWGDTLAVSQKVRHVDHIGQPSCPAGICPRDKEACVLTKTRTSNASIRTRIRVTVPKPIGSEKVNCRICVQWGDTYCRAGERGGGSTRSTPWIGLQTVTLSARNDPRNSTLHLST